MTEIRKILFCTDFSENADHAFKEACSMASVTGSHLYILHVVPSSLDYEKMCLEECVLQPFPGEAKVRERKDEAG